MNDLERNLPLLTLRPDNRPQDERQHGSGLTREIPFSSHPDYAAYAAAYASIALAPEQRARLDQIDILLDQDRALESAWRDYHRRQLRWDREAYKIDLFTRAARAANPWIAGLTAAAMTYCILST